MMGRGVFVDLQSILDVEEQPLGENGLKTVLKVFPRKYLVGLNKICEEAGVNRRVVVKGAVDSRLIGKKTKYGKTPALVGISYSPENGSIHIGYKFAKTLVDKYKNGGKGGVTHLFLHEDGHAHHHDLARKKHLRFLSRSEEEKLQEEEYAVKYALKHSKNPIDDYVSSIAIIAEHHKRVCGDPLEYWVKELAKLHRLSNYLNKRTVDEINRRIQEKLGYGS